MMTCSTITQFTVQWKSMSGPLIVNASQIPRYYSWILTAWHLDSAAHFAHGQNEKWHWIGDLRVINMKLHFVVYGAHVFSDLPRYKKNNNALRQIIPRWIWKVIPRKTCVMWDMPSKYLRFMSGKNAKCARNMVKIPIKVFTNFQKKRQKYPSKW